jgi:transcriptional regulator with XRE-family HTH domain
MKCADIVCQIRKELNLNRKELAKLTGVTETYIYYIEKGGKLPSHSFIQGLAAVYLDESKKREVLMERLLESCKKEFLRKKKEIAAKQAERLFCAHKLNNLEC